MAGIEQYGSIRVEIIDLNPGRALLKIGVQASGRPTECSIELLQKLCKRRCVSKYWYIIIVSTNRYMNSTKHVA